MNYRLALVTGASSGLGRTLACLLAKKGIPLFLTGRNEKALEELASTLEVPTIYDPADLSDPTQRKRLIKKIKELVPDLVINNAGFGFYGPALLHSTQEEMAILEVNANAVLEISLESARALIDQRRQGVIMNISSVAAFFAYPSFSVYAASKSFVTQFSMAFDTELKPFGIRVLTACPGQIDTSFRKRAAKDAPQKKNPFVMTAHQAAHAILKQIEQKKRLHVFNWRYKLIVLLSKCFPQSWVQKWLEQKILSRIQKKSEV